MDEAAQQLADRLGLTYHAVLEDRAGEQRLVKSHDASHAQHFFDPFGVSLLSCSRGFYFNCFLSVVCLP